jgi:putative transposase
MATKKASRFGGLRLTAKDRRALAQMQTGGTKESARTWRRIRTLLLLDEGLSVRATALAVGGYPREVSRVGKRYLAGGLEHALTDDPRPTPGRMLDSIEESAIVAMVCGPPPEGCARWSVRLAASEAVRRGIVERVGRELVRLILADHDLKPWREKNVVRGQDRRRVRGANGGRPTPVRTPKERL